MTDGEMTSSLVRELIESIDDWRNRYMDLGYELGEVINEQQDVIVAQARRIKHLERANWNLKKNKRRR
ncbi:hypothetical protein [Streptococcus sp. sy010]|uniref:hypothetical protein n=1 Tax=Streptococcus sp. sy010 TaxID=2600148 RepID=UPI0011B7DF90|nr:hypothetical protein [Streptococcus sp. sy010]TWT16433.1 hypothetical protein FRX51_00530 [Streptococcus sp. sy010]